MNGLDGAHPTIRTALHDRPAKATGAVIRRTLTAAQNFWRIWSNTFTIPGVILVCVGLLSLISREGTFDSLAYAGRSLIRMFERGRKHIRFGDYVMERREKRKEKKSMVAPFMVVGGLFVAAAVFCLVMYYQV